jgi:putative MATE family efflux protein
MGQYRISGDAIDAALRRGGGRHAVGRRPEAEAHPVVQFGRRLWAADREILVLAVPALGALVSEPLFLLADSAIVGALGTEPLAGLGIAGAVLATAVNLFVFLAYGTTASVARRLGAGDRRGALAQGIDGLWLAGGLGVVAAAVTGLGAPALVGLFDAETVVSLQAVDYLRWSAPGVPGMLVVLAATGVLRGLADTRTPLLVAGSGAVVNAGLNLLLVHGVGLGIAGSGLGTALTQVGMAVGTAIVVVRAARREGTPLRPDAAGIRAGGLAGVPLLVRTLALRAALLTTTYVAARLGSAPLAAHQVTSTIWTLLALTLDAIAIAAQALTGRFLGAGDVVGVRATTRRMVHWGVGTGVLLMLVLLALRQYAGPLFSPDPAVRSALSAALVVAALMQPLAGFVFVLDGVLIGAGDGRYLAMAAAAQFVFYLPLAVAVAWFGPGGTAGLVWLWLSFAGGWMAARAAFLGRRARGDRWLVVGATKRP